MGHLLITDPDIVISINEYFKNLWLKNAGNSVYIKIEHLE